MAFRVARFEDMQEGVQNLAREARTSWLAKDSRHCDDISIAVGTINL